MISIVIMFVAFVNTMSFVAAILSGFGLIMGFGIQVTEDRNWWTKICLLIMALCLLVFYLSSKLLRGDYGPI